MKLRAKKVQQELRAGFAKLPAPKFAFDVAPSAPVVGTKTSGKDEVETDKGELEEEAKRLAGQLEVEKLEKRSESLKRRLPRPDDGEAALLGDTKVAGDDDLVGLSEDVQSLVRKRIGLHYQLRNAMYPVAAEGGTSTLRKRKRPLPWRRQTRLWQRIVKNLLLHGMHLRTLKGQDHGIGADEY